MADNAAEPELFLNNVFPDSDKSLINDVPEPETVSGQEPVPEMEPVLEQEPEPLNPLNFIKRSFTEIFEGKIRFVYRLILAKNLELNEKISWDNFIIKQKYLFNITDNSQTDIFTARVGKTKDYNLNIVRSIHYSEERFLKGEFDQEECDSRFMTFATELFKQYILWKGLRDFKPKEESLKISIEDLGISSNDYSIT